MLNRILEISNNSVKIEINDEGNVTGKYKGIQLSTIESQSHQDGTSTWTGKFIQMTTKRDMIVAIGTGTGKAPTSKGVVKLRGEGEMWTQSPKLSTLNGAKWTSEGESDIKKGRSVIYVDIHEKE